MYTTKTNKGNLSSLMVTITIILFVAMLFNMQYVYAEIDILGQAVDMNEPSLVPQPTNLLPANTEQLDKFIQDTTNRQMIVANEIMTKAIEQKAEERRQKEMLEQQRLERQRQEELRRMTTVESSRNVQYYEINVYTDLSVMTTITTDQMNEIIDHWAALRNWNTPFVGQGQIFIDAAKKSGLDPIYILAHAAVESGWGTSSLAQYHHNYFGIGAFDSNPSYASNYGNSDLAAGIIEGAKWIARNYYDQGQTSLYSMRYNNGVHEYCTSTTWIYNISSIMSTSYSLI